MKLLTKHGNKILATMLAICLVVLGGIVPGHANALDDLRDTVNAIIARGYLRYDTQYAGTCSIYDHTLKQITEQFTPEQVEIYLQCVITGDYYPFRTSIGKFEPMANFTVSDYAMGKGSVIDYEYVTFHILGPYATVQDYINQC